MDFKLELYRDNLAMVNHLAVKFSKKYAMDREELYDLGRFVLAVTLYEKWDEYDSTKSKPITFLYQKVYWKLLEECTRNKENDHMSFTDAYGNKHPAHKTKPDKVKGLLAELSEEGQFLVKTIIDAPAELAGVMCPKTKGRAREALKNYLQNKCDWSHEKIWNIWKEVDQCLP